MDPFVAVTDKAWFDYLLTRAAGGRVDEVNFWSPLSQRPLKRFGPGDPVFFRLKSPYNAIAGYGFFAHFAVLGLNEAWRLFQWRNGDPFEAAFLQRIGKYRHLDLLDSGVRQEPMGCTVLRDARFWSPAEWMTWGEAQGWPRNSVRGMTARDPVRAQLLLERISFDALHREVAAELDPAFELVEVDGRKRREAELMVREGQGTFRARLLDAYGNRCAITGEHTEPVLDAAHIQPYLGPRSNHVQNGLLLTKEFHTLFDLGLVGVTPAYKVRVSRALRDRWHNGRRYYAYDALPLVAVPERAPERPSPSALEWHLRNTFVA
jgi:putative restriction endonuclease